MDYVEILNKFVGSMGMVIAVLWVIWYLFTKEGDKQYKAWREVYWEDKKAPHNMPL